MQAACDGSTDWTESLPAPIKTFLKKAVASRATAGIVPVAQGCCKVNAAQESRGFANVDSEREPDLQAHDEPA